MDRQQFAFDDNELSEKASNRLPKGPSGSQTVKERNPKSAHGAGSAIEHKKKPSAKIPSDRNPLLPLKRYLMYSRLNASEAGDNQTTIDPQFDEMIQKYSGHGNAAPHLGGDQKHLINSGMKLEEMLTISILKSGRYSGSVKKMLHVPTLRLYAVKEEPVQTREIRQNLREWITLWQNIENSPQNLVRVHSTFWNTPEGCVSIVMDYLAGGSLQNLLESVGSLPESAIQSIALQIIEGLESLHTKCHIAHCALLPSQVCFDHDGQVKVIIAITSLTILLDWARYISPNSAYEEKQRRFRTRCICP